MTKTELVAALAESLNMPKAQVTRVVDGLVDMITSNLQKGHKVQISQLGVFERKMRDARPGRNPQTGEEITIPARHVVVYRPAKSLKEAVK